jgi:hypothetical protein
LTPGATPQHSQETAVYNKDKKENGKEKKGKSTTTN